MHHSRKHYVACLGAGARATDICAVPRIHNFATRMHAPSRASGDTISMQMTLRDVVVRPVASTGLFVTRSNMRLSNQATVTVNHLGKGGLLHANTHT